MVKEPALLDVERLLQERWVQPVEWQRPLQRTGQLPLQVYWPQLPRQLRLLQLPLDRPMESERVCERQPLLGLVEFLHPFAAGPCPPLAASQPKTSDPASPVL